MIANRIQDFVESKHLLTPGHFGGRQRRSTTNALTRLTTWIKSKWRENEVVRALFVDVQETFPTVHPTHMVSTLSSVGIWPSICNLIQNYLTSFSTIIAFGEYKSAPESLTIGLLQGSPLLVILYIIYNSSLLHQSSDFKDTIALGFINDVAFATAAHSNKEVVDNLQILASQEIQWGK